MIAIANQKGELIKVFPMEAMEFGLHQVFGFVNQETLKERMSRRRSQGISSQENSWVCKLKLSGNENAIQLEPVFGAEVSAQGKVWNVKTNRGTYQVMPAAEAKLAPIAEQTITSPYRKSFIIALMVLLAIPAMLGRSKIDQPVIVVPESVIVKLKPQVQKPVVVPSSVPMENSQTIKNQDRVVKRAIQQNLGFLGLLGNKNITKAIGGAPTIKDASAGAGAGGKEGSGGEYLTGLGRGVKHATVGNSGVSGLGGIGTKGAGGGAGGYGNTMIGSGEGKSLSKVALSNDLMLEGGLDKAVIQATIAKYLSQVRACYEGGLQSNPALQGQVNMNFVISGTGSVSSANVAKSTLGNAAVENCISTKMLNWNFPKPVGGVNVKVNYPFVLRPVGA